MNGKTGFSRIIRGILLGLMLAWLTACASGPRVVDHAFSFDARGDSPDAEVLNYRYGDSNLPGTRIPPALLRESGVSGGTGINGPMPLGDSLYAKWRIKSTGAVFEDTVDLKRRLPWDITDHRIYFIVEGSQLYVYLISRDPIRGYLTPDEVAKADREMTTPRQKALRIYIRHRITQLYPDHPQTNKTKQGE